MNKTDRILSDVLKKITPSKKEKKEIELIRNTVLKITDKVIKPFGLEKTIAGSFIRDTWLRDKKEFDLFIMFPVPYSRERLEKLGLEIGKKIIEKLKGSYEISYAEHPYVRGKIKGFGIDIVPCYKVESASKIKSAVDRTPFHNEYILKHLKPEMSGDVRLLKQFTKSLGVYGSDTKTLGFSGYLCELLIIKHGSFKNLVEHVSGWEPGNVFIDLQSHSIVQNPKKYFKDQPLVVIDPTDPKRNVAAALSPVNFVKFVNAARKFVKKPSKAFFEIKRSEFKLVELQKMLKRRKTKLLAVVFKRPEVIDDILFPQLRKSANRTKNMLEDEEFKVMGFEVWSDEKTSCIFLELEVWKLPETKKLRGPHVFSKLHSKQFIEKYRKSGKIYVEDIYWFAEVKRKFRDADKKLKDFLSQPKKDLIENGIGSYLSENISKDFRILKDQEVLRLVHKNPEFGCVLNWYFKRDLI